MSSQHPTYRGEDFAESLDIRAAIFPGTAEEQAAAEDKFNRSFSTSKPRHVVEGMLSGLGEVVRGVGLGLMSFVMSPAAGAAQDGVTGFGKGICVGTAGLASLSLTGAVAGAGSVIEGIKNTPAAWEKYNDKEQYLYNSKTGEYSLKYQELDVGYEEAKLKFDDYKRIAKEEAGRRSYSCDITRARLSREVTDTFFYDILEVTTDATQNEIRRSYYRLAKDCHPDKQQNDPTATERFQGIGEAYQVLNYESRREEYDKHGKAVTDKMNLMDGSIVFAMLFGNDKMEPYVGKFKLAAMFDEEMLPEGNDDASCLLRKIRELYLACELRRRLQPFVLAQRSSPVDNAAVSTWLNAMKAEADMLYHCPFGPLLVETIGVVYENEAERYIVGKESVSQSQKAKWRSVRRQQHIGYAAMSEAAWAAKLSRKAQKNRVGQRNEEQRALDTMEESLKHEQRAMMHICIREIHSVVTNACDQCLHDKAVDEVDQRSRADGLRHIGQLFTEQAKKYDKEAAQNQGRRPKHR